MLKSLLTSFLRRRAPEARGDIDAAVQCFRAGRHAAAEELARAIVREDPAHAQAWNLLGAIALEGGNEDGALGCFETAREAAPRDADIGANLAEARRRAGDLDPAESLARSVLEFAPSHVASLHTLALVLAAQGRGQEAFECYQRLLALDPDFTPARGGYLFLLNVADVLEPERIAAEHRRFMQRIQVPSRWGSLRHANIPEPGRRLRVAYVSPDFYRHAVSYFIEPVLAGHDRDAFEVVCYSGVRRPDEITQKLRGYAAVWRDVAELDDEGLAELILDDGVDILVDLSGHTAKNRIAVFARKPAPLQLTWFGYPGTTGLETMDYRITDALCDPPGASEHLYTETLLRLPDSMYCYQPPDDAPEVRDPPVLRNGYVTFGGMTGATRLSPRGIALWAGLLRQIPQARLALAVVPRGAAVERLRALFSGHGIDAGRILFHERMPYQEFWGLCHDIDIALDTQPCNGGTTTCEVMWMGVPAVTFAGGRFGGNRLGTSMLTSLGLTELVARTAEDYVAIASALASDPKRLAVLRHGMRARMRAAPLTGRDRFMHHLETAYRSIWRDWCAGRASRA